MTLATVGMPDSSVPQDSASSRSIGALLIGFVGLACAYLFLLEPWGHDLWFHLHRLQDLESQLNSGRFPADLSENLVGGKGLPVYIYYSQWVYWPALLLRELGITPLISLKLVLCLFLTVSCVGCYLLLRQHVDRTSALFGALLYTTSNYVIGDVFVRSAYAEFLSYSLSPLLLLSLYRILVHADFRFESLLVIIASLMILFHPLSFMNFTLCISAYAVYVSTISRTAVSSLTRAVMLFFLALGLTAFYWLPALIEKPYVLGTEGMPMRLSDTFMTISKYLNFASVTSLGFALTTASIGVIGYVALFARGMMTKGGRAGWPLLAGVAAYVCLTLPLSAPLWRDLPFVAANNFVWRLIFPLTVLLVLVLVNYLQALPRIWRQGSILMAAAGIAFVQATVFIGLHTWSDVSSRRISTSDIERALVAESSRTEGWGIDEYRPNQHAVPIIAQTCVNADTSPGTDKYGLTFPIAAPDAERCFRIERFWNVRYTATLNGEALPISANEKGEIVIAPQGRAGILSLHFSRPGYVTHANLLSGFAVMLVLLLLTRGLIARRQKPIAQSAAKSD